MIDFWVLVSCFQENSKGDTDKGGDTGINNIGLHMQQKSGAIQLFVFNVRCQAMLVHMCNWNYWC